MEYPIVMDTSAPSYGIDIISLLEFNSPDLCLVIKFLGNVRFRHIELQIAMRRAVSIIYPGSQLSKDFRLPGNPTKIGSRPRFSGRLPGRMGW